MVLILDDEHLESLQCSSCHKYLSLFPVKNHPNHQVTCGRCSGTDADKEDGVRSNLYELVANEYIFRCVNRYEGCRKLLRAEETEEHEKVCLGNFFACPKCEDGIVDKSVLELIWHYKHYHPSSCLKSNYFEGTPPSRDVMLYVQSDVVFFIFLQYDSKVLHLCASTLSEGNITQAFEIKRGSFWEKSEKTPCKVLSAFNDNYHVFRLESVESVQVIFNLNVSKRSFKLFDVSVAGTSKTVDRMGPGDVIQENEKFPVKPVTKLEIEMGYELNDNGTGLLHRNGQMIDLTCSNCKQFIGRYPIYRCKARKHQICDDCWTWCGICDASVKLCRSDDLLKQIGKYLKFPCRWKCGRYFTSDFKNHERSFELKIFKCPICPSTINSLDLFKNHLITNHKQLNFCGDYEVLNFPDLVQQKRNGEHTFLFHDRYCYFRCSQKNNSLYDLYFGLFRDEPNVKLGICKESKLPNGEWSTKCFYDVIRNLNIDHDDYKPYLNFNYMK